MAGVTRGREAGRDVIGVGGAVIVGQMAVDAGTASEAVVVVDVALRTLQAGVGAGQGEACRGVVERCSKPIDGGVAHAAILRESCSLMGRVGGAVVVGQVAVDASRAGQTVVIVDVALRAL